MNAVVCQPNHFIIIVNPELKTTGCRGTRSLTKRLCSARCQVAVVIMVVTMMTIIAPPPSPKPKGVLCVTPSLVLWVVVDLGEDSELVTPFVTVTTELDSELSGGGLAVVVKVRVRVRVRGG